MRSLNSILVESTSDLSEKRISTKELKNGKWQYNGKTGVWRTLANGDHVFFTDDGDRLAAGQTEKGEEEAAKVTVTKTKKVDNSGYKSLMNKMKEVASSRKRSGGSKGTSKPASKSGTKKVSQEAPTEVVPTAGGTGSRTGKERDRQIKRLSRKVKDPNVKASDKREAHRQLAKLKRIKSGSEKATSKPKSKPQTPEEKKEAIKNRMADLRARKSKKPEGASGSASGTPETPKTPEEAAKKLDDPKNQEKLGKAVDDVASDLEKAKKGEKVNWLDIIKSLSGGIMAMLGLAPAAAMAKGLSGGASESFEDTLTKVLQENLGDEDWETLRRAVRYGVDAD